MRKIDAHGMQEDLDVAELFSGGMTNPPNKNPLVGEALEEGSLPEWTASEAEFWDPSQPRVPAGNPAGGQWASGTAAGGMDSDISDAYMAAKVYSLGYKL